MTDATALAKCPNCKGKMLPVTPPGKPSYNRCRACGCDDRPVPAAPPAPTTPCTVKGCPGRVVQGVGCACCATRAKWVEEHKTTIPCEICGGEIIANARGGRRRYCPACAPHANRVAVIEIQRRKRAEAKRAGATK